MKRLSLYKTALRAFAIFAVAVLALCACTSRTRHEAAFSRARAVMDSLPETALAILDSIPAAELQPGLDSARYILLHALAENKAHALATPDSLLQAAIDVFREHGETADLRNANYILGTSLDYQERYSEAIVKLLDAENLIDDSTPPYEKGLIYNELAECCNATLNGELAVKYIRLAHAAFTDADKPLHAAYALYGNATFYNNNAEYNIAIPLFTEVKALADTLNDDNLGYAATAGIGYSNFGLGDYETALQYFHAIPSGVQAMDTQGIAIWAETEQKAGDINIADSLAHILMERGDYRWIYAIDPKTISIEEVVSAYSHQEETGMQMYLDTYRDKFPTVLEKNLLLREELVQTRFKYSIWIIVCLTVLAIIVSAYMYTLIKNYRARLKEKEEALLILSNDFITFSREQQDKISQTSKLRDEALNVTQSMMKERTVLLHNLLYSYHGRREDSKETIRDITRCVYQLIEDLRSPKAISDLEHMVNICHDNVTERLMTENPPLSKEELRLFIYLASGLDTHILLEIYQVESPVFRKRKSRLRNKLASMDSPNVGEYLRFF